jgi:hypothetical protein
MEKLLAYHNMKKIELEINEKNELVNKNGDTFTIKSEQFDDFLLLGEVKSRLIEWKFYLEKFNSTYV